MATTPTRRSSGPRAELGERLRGLAPLAQFTLSAEAMRPLVADVSAVGVAAFVAGLAYECRCNYRMVADQAVFTRRPSTGG